MPLYFLVLDATPFNQHIRPALAASWRLRSFAPCRSLCAHLLPALDDFVCRFGTRPADFLLPKVADGMAFDRLTWRALAGEILLLAAVATPEIETAPATLTYLVSRKVPTDDTPRLEERSPIEQVHFGTHAVRFGGAFYRPEHAGLNETDDVVRLAAYLAGLDADRWTAADLEGLPGLEDASDRQEELAWVRDWLPELRAMYERAAGRGRIIVSEVL